MFGFGAQTVTEFALLSDYFLIMDVFNDLEKKIPFFHKNSAATYLLELSYCSNSNKYLKCALKELWVLTQLGREISNKYLQRI